MRADGYPLTTLRVLTGCGGTEPDIPRLPGTLYEVLRPGGPHEPRRRLRCGLIRVYMALSRRGTFELRLDVADHCPSQTPEWRYFGVDASGGYYLDSDRSDFYPNLNLIPAPVVNGRGDVIDTLPPMGLSAFSGRIEGVSAPDSDAAVRPCYDAV
jgi:hypothetical protein